MRVHRIDWKLFALIAGVFLFDGLAASPASAQTYQRINECTASLNAQTDALQRDQPALLVSSARWYLTNCRDLFREPDDEAGVLSELGNALAEQGNFDDAIPILQRCVAIKPDAAYCFASMGEAYLGLGKIEDAQSKL